MELLLVRHAEAEERASNGRDEARALTAKGRKRFTRAVRGLARLDVEFDQLLHSPLLRAMETADLCAPLVVGELRVASELARDPSTELLALCTGLRVALVGHEPWMSELCAWLVTGERERAPQFAFQKGGVARLSGELAPGAMRLVAFWPPDTLAELGRK